LHLAIRYGHLDKAGLVRSGTIVVYYTKPRIRIRSIHCDAAPYCTVVVRWLVPIEFKFKAGRALRRRKRPSAKGWLLWSRAARAGLGSLAVPSFPSLEDWYDRNWMEYRLAVSSYLPGSLLCLPCTLQRSRQNKRQSHSFFCYY